MKHDCDEQRAKETGTIVTQLMKSPLLAKRLALLERGWSVKRSGDPDVLVGGKLSNEGFGVQGWEFGVWGLVVGVWGLGFVVSG